MTRSSMEHAYLEDKCIQVSSIKALLGSSVDKQA